MSFVDVTQDNRLEHAPNKAWAGLGIKCTQFLCLPNNILDGSFPFSAKNLLESITINLASFQ